MTEAQIWLNARYPNKETGGEVRLYNEKKGVEELTGEVLIEGRKNVEKINLERWDKRKPGGKLKGRITKVTIKYCPKLKELNLNGNKISEIIFEGDFPDLVRVDATDNELVEFDVSAIPNLEWLNIARNPFFIKIKGLEHSKKLKFINSSGTLGIDFWEYREWRKRPTQQQLEDEVANERKKFENYIAPNELEAEAEKAGMFTKEKYDKVVNELDKWKNTFNSKSPEKAKEELEAKPTGSGAGTTLTSDQQQKLNDYEKMVAYLRRDMGKDWETHVLSKNK